MRNLAMAVAVFAFCGCSESPEAKAKREKAAALARANLIHAIGSAYRNHLDSFAYGPASHSELLPYLGDAKPNAEEAAQQKALKSGEIVVNPRLHFRKAATAGLAAQVLLVWEKDVPKQGGHVVGFDGFARTMTAAEFAALPNSDGARVTEKEVEEIKQQLASDRIQYLNRPAPPPEGKR